MKKNKLNSEQLKYIKEQLKPIETLFSSIVIGDFDVSFNIPKDESEFSSLYAGIKLLFDSSKEKLTALNKTNNQLKEKSQKKGLLLDELQEIAHIGSWEWSVGSTEINCSDETLKIFELYPRKENVTIQDLVSFTHKEDKKVVFYMLKKALEDLRPFKIHQRILIKNNILKIIEIRGSVGLDNNHTPVKMYGTVQDITQIKETKEKLFLIKQQLEAKVDERTRDLKRAYRNLEQEMQLKEKSLVKEKKLADIVASSDDAIISKSIDGHIESWNKGAEKIYGYTEQEIIGKHISTIIPNEKIEEFNDVMLRIVQGKKINSFHTIRRTKNGELIDISSSISPIKNHLGEIIGASAISRDITDEKNANRRFEIAVEAAPNAMIMVNESGKIVMLNNQTEKMFGYNHDELLGQPIEVLIPSELRKNHVSSRSNYQENPSTRAMGIGRELYGIRKDGCKVILEIGLNPIHTKEGKFVLASVVDVTERKKIEYELQKSEQKYRTLIETMNEGVLMTDNNNVITFANDFMCKMLGYELDEMLGKIIYDLLLDEHASKIMKKIMTLRKNGIANKYEIQLLTKQKQKLWMLISGSPIYDSNNKIIGSVGLHTNITNRKLMEEELNSIANIPTENPNPTFRFSIHGQILMYANPASKDTLDFFDNESNLEVRNEWVKEINNAYKNGNPIKKELLLKGRTYMCTIVPIRKNKYVNVYAVDITSAKEAEAEIKKLSLVLSKTENAVVIADKNGNILWVNDGFKRVTGYSLNEVVYTHGEQLRHGKKTGLNPNHPYFKKMIDTKQSISYESHNFKKNGIEYWSITTLTPIFDNDNNIESIIAIDTDITHKKIAEKETIRAKKIAEESAKSKELFLANMSHEIRTPMNAIMGIAQLLKETKLDQTQLDYLKSMDFAGQNLLRIINDVLDLAKIDSGKMSIEAIPFSIVELVNDLFHSLTYRVNEKGISLIKDIDENVPKYISGDPVRLNQILINLINNSIKFTKKGYIKLTIKAEVQSPDIVKIIFKVEDTGIGIPKEMQELVFCDFEQANKETTRIYGGTGLGLSIVKRLLNLQKGTIRLDSEENKGSTFTFEIPYGTSDNLINPSAPVQNISMSTALQDLRVLLVEDNKLNQMVATKFIEGMGAKVTLANDGVECLSELDANDLDIILMDIQMPNMDGYTAATYIRSKMSGAKRKIPILAMTAHAISGEKEKCIAAGMSDYISKPLNKENLMKKIIELLNT